MGRAEEISVKEAVHKLQLSLLEGIQNEDQLFAAGSLISRSDYQDVVTERSIANTCGYPLCRNALPPERPRKGRYRISLKEHRVYDLNETYMYCSTGCVVNSRAFAGSLQEERCSVLSSAKLNEILRLFESLGLDREAGLGKNEDLGLSELRIQEKTDVKAGQVSLEEWIGPSNAVEGYVPQRDRNSQPLRTKTREEGSQLNHAKPIKGKNVMFDEMDFRSTIICQDEYNISKTLPGSVTAVKNAKSKQSKEKHSSKQVEHQFTIMEMPLASVHTDSAIVKEPEGEKGSIRTSDKLGISEGLSQLCQNSPDINVAGAREGTSAVKAAQFSATVPKSALKSTGAKKQSRSVTWADEKSDGAENRNLCEVRDLENTKDHADKVRFPDQGDNDSSVRFLSAEACAIALGQAAEAVASGDYDITDAVSEAGIIILPPPQDVDEGKSQEQVNMVEPEPTTSKWPKKPGVPNYNLFDSEDSWYDSPPEGFSLSLSPFATIWSALFEWISSSSVAYIYGRDDSFREEYFSVNGREYPHKIASTDGRSSEIKQTLAGCLARALPGLVEDLRLPVLLSTLEHEL
ncbi:putative RNA polymerase II subunit B1 CTD phosphatase RPAP2 homolog isoform X2 [Diospyros lotus]|nr:putative RNA polymerase II subunit B1 CTD phosphatase RPAP2 homolog isoform X2 [Diospyros lotus]